MTQHLLCIGYGFSARALAAQLLVQGWQVSGTTRSETKAAEIEKTGTRAIVWPGTDLRSALEQASHLLISAAPGPEGDPFLHVYQETIEKMAGRFDWVGYLSTTGVYGDRQGGWVDEDTPLAPATKRGQARVAAEAQWQSIDALPIHIFRLAGIYGPGRGPFAKIRNGTARRIIKKNQLFSRVHVDDIARALALSIEAPQPGEIYNLCDDDPAPPQDVIGYAAKLLGMSPPPEVPIEEAEMSPMARSFYAESKRVRNDKAKRQLGWDPQYKTYKSALEAILKAGG